MQPPAIGAFGSANISVGTSIAERTTPVAAMVGLVSISTSLVYPLIKFFVNSY